MDVLVPRRRPKGPAPDPEEGRANPAVSWIAIVVGVFLVAIGILLLLWGLSWQGATEEDDPLDPDRSVGGPYLLPLGAFVIAVGAIWILNGYKVFGRKKRDGRPCHRCGRTVEQELAFCYHCGAEMADEKAPAPHRNARR